MAPDSSASVSSFGREERPTEVDGDGVHGAAKIDGSVPLGDAAEADLAEIRAVAAAGNINLNIFVQLHGQGEPRRYHFGDGTPAETVEAVPTSELDFKNGQALSDFVEYSIDQGRPSPPRLLNPGDVGPRIRLRVRSVTDVRRGHCRS